MSILERLADPEGFANMPMNEKLLGTLYVAILGIGITFSVLIFLQYCIKFMSWLLNAKKPMRALVVQEDDAAPEHPVANALEQEGEELVAVIAAAAAAFMGCPAECVVLRNVRRLDSGAPTWARAGLMDQMALRKS